MEKIKGKQQNKTESESIENGARKTETATKNKKNGR